MITEETRKKMSLAFKGIDRFPSSGFKKGDIPWNKGTKGLMISHWKGKKLSTEHKNNISKNAKNNPNYSMRGKKHSLESRRKMSIACMGRKHTEASKRKMSKSHIGVKLSKEHRRNIGLAVSGEKNGMYGVSCPSKNTDFKGGIYNEIRMRSSWEINIAKHLDKHNIVWIYEPKRFYFKGEKFTYLPDFYLPEYDLYVEVKGFIFSNEQTLKMQLFMEKYSLLIIKGKLYKSIIENEVNIVELMSIFINKEEVSL